MWLNIAILSLVTLQRLVELYIARRNTQRLLARGGYEAGSGHYWLIVILHAAWIIGLWVYARDNEVNWTWLFVYLAIEALRGWVVAALGDRWTTRIIVMPGEPLVARGPYRYLRHPNYIVVALEIFVLPMVFGMFWYAIGFTIANAAILYWRIRIEEETFKEATPPAEKTEQS
jgi:methyltransferase